MINSYLPLLKEHLIRSINDPEHPLTLEQLNVVEQSLVEVDDVNNYVKVQFTPTIPHCSMATLIGLAIRVQLLRSLPERFKVQYTLIIRSHSGNLIHIVNTDFSCLCLNPCDLNLIVFCNQKLPVRNLLVTSIEKLYISEKECLLYSTKFVLNPR